MKLLATFLLFVCFFTFLRYPIGEFSAWMLSITSEVRITDDSEPSDQEKYEFNKKKKKFNKKKVKKKKKKKTIDRGKPVTVKLPKTKTPIILICDDFPDWSDKVASDFPSFRRANGKEWNKDQTNVRVTSDGKKIYMLLKLYDKFPKKAITKHSESNSGGAWKDDSIEIFLMKQANSKVYCQFILSVSGIGHCFYINAGKEPYTSNKIEKPENLDKWSYDVEEFDNRFEMEISIPLSNIGINKLKANDTFLLQIIRNYRGQNDKNAVTLQLFPTHLYADSRFGINNHDRRAFQKVKVVNADVFAALDKTEVNFLK